MLKFAPYGNAGTYKKYLELKNGMTFDLGGITLDLYWTFWGTPYEDFYHIADSKAYLKCLKHSLSEKIRPFNCGQVKDNTMSLMGRRQRHADFDLETKMTFNPQNKETAGIVIMQASC